MFVINLLTISNLIIQGGDEFAIVLTETSKKESEMIINRINEKLNKISPNFEYKIGVSMGVATEKGEKGSLE
ncbi:MAG: diguanylate cyclase, partial [Bacillota bacterium]|nr:diguanylate cyclase [Bacillota bacterium]